jgi:hypothetical protein
MLDNFFLSFLKGKCQQYCFYRKHQFIKRKSINFPINFTRHCITESTTKVFFPLKNTLRYSSYFGLLLSTCPFHIFFPNSRILTDIFPYSCFPLTYKNRLSQSTGRDAFPIFSYTSSSSFSRIRYMHAH